MLPAAFPLTAIVVSQGRSDKETCELGIERVAKPKGRRLHGWGKITLTDIEAVDLEIDRDDNPLGHANVVRWPEDRADRKATSQKLARLVKCAVRIVPPAKTCADCGTYDLRPLLSQENRINIT